MEGGDRASSLNDALNISSKKGYILYQDLDSIAEKNSLSLSDLDWVCNELSIRGVLLYDKSPVNEGFDEEDYVDMAHLDYDEIYEKIKKIAPSLSFLVNKVSQIIPPQFCEIQRLKYQVIEGNKYARRRMIEMHLRIALKIALQRAEQFDAIDEELIDLVDIACLGLITAVDKYNPDENGAFQGYASMWMLQNLNRYQLPKRVLINYSYQKRNLYFEAYPFLKSCGCIGCTKIVNCNKARKKLIEGKGWKYTDADDAINETIADELFSQISDIDYLNDSGWDCFLAELAISSIKTLDASLDKIENQEMHDILWNALGQLSDKEQYIVKARNGFTENDGEMTLEDIGKQLEVTRERIRQIEARAYRKLCDNRQFRRQIREFHF